MVMSHRYLVFAGMYYYPKGAASDYVGRFDVAEEAKAAGLAAEPDYKGEKAQWVEIIDLATGKWTRWNDRQSRWEGQW